MTAHAEATSYPRAGPAAAVAASSCARWPTRAPGSGCCSSSSLLGAAIVTITLIAGNAEDQNLPRSSRARSGSSRSCCPVVGILAVTSEWTQRTGLTTFALVPERERVIAAKVVAAVALALGAVVRVPRGGRRRQPVRGRELEPPAARCSARARCSRSSACSRGIAFGLVFMNSPLAIVLYFLLPTVWTILGETIHALDKPADWLDMSRTMEGARRRRHDRQRLGAAGHLGRRSGSAWCC